RFQTVYWLEHGDWRKVRIVGNGMKLSARVRVKSNDSHRREAKKHSRRQSTYYGHTQNGI
ncbi:MAG: hypothetical protein WBV98_06690, partial [Candidatus Sulfotelmatobacter sp.]